MRRDVDFTLNGHAVRVSGERDRPLLSVLRNELDLKGSRFGCGLEQCGACMVLVEDDPVPACTRAISTVAGRHVTTVEGLSLDAPHPLQIALIEHQAGQCGYCLSGILISAFALLKRRAAPSRSEIVEALDRHLCRCGAHNRIIAAVETAALRMRGEGGRLP